MGMFRPSRALPRTSLAILLAGCAVAGCTMAPRLADKVVYRGAMDVFLEPADAQGVCAVTLGLRNISGARQGEARLHLAWQDRQGALLAEQSLRMDPTDIDQYDAKNLVLPVTCDRVHRVKVRSAEWRLGWDISTSVVVPIDAVDGTERLMRWDDQLRLFVGQPAGEPASG